jgi:hypothetical protein
MRVTFRPIDQWPGEPTPAYQRKSKYTFKGTYDSTLRLLDDELRHLDAEGLVIQLEMAEKDIRLDGMPRSNATPKGPAVIVSFESKHGPLRYATDVFDHWHANLRAIALGLEALRKVERYGITKRGEQYTGWKQLGSGMPMPAAQMTADEAAAFVARASGDPNLGGFEVLQQWPEYGDAYYRDAAKRLHPDSGGSTPDFQRLQDAKRVLDEAGS